MRIYFDDCFYFFQGSILLSKIQWETNGENTKEYLSDEEDDESRYKEGDEIKFPVEKNGKSVPFLMRIVEATFFSGR